MNKNSNYYFVLLAILAMVVIVESIMIVGSLNRKTANQPILPKNILVTETKKGILGITLEENQKITAGQELKAQLVFNSFDEKLAGIDAIITYNPKLVSLSAIKPNSDLFKQILINDQQKSSGRIKITAYQPIKDITGQLVLADLELTPLNNTASVVSFEFKGPDRITDSNLVAANSQKDILSSIQPLKLTPVK